MPSVRRASRANRQRLRRPTQVSRTALEAPEERVDVRLQDALHATLTWGAKVFGLAEHNSQTRWSGEGEQAECGKLCGCRRDGLVSAQWGMNAHKRRQNNSLFMAPVAGAVCKPLSYGGSDGPERERDLDLVRQNIERTVACHVHQPIFCTKRTESCVLLGLMRLRGFATAGGDSARDSDLACPFSSSIPIFPASIRSLSMPAGIHRQPELLPQFRPLESRLWNSPVPLPRA